MRLKLIASLIIAAPLFITTTAHAQLTSQISAGANFTQPVPTTGNNPGSTSSATMIAAAPTTSNAIEFANEAGRLGGIAQACGQDISLFTTRINEAISKLALNMPDKILATQSFQIALKQAQSVQTSKNIVPCGQMLKDFSNLPILRSDYQQTVIANLNPDMNPNNNAAPTASNNLTNNQALPNTITTAPQVPTNQNGTTLQQYIGK